eukprot:TRINITY_DN205_c0_g1_i1.p1 TRINITY_DN205_c0_g1~~TRINITY_DN205_c0_g1_i1.p1  ORF type:complete len:499 (+),score=87.22 TRINITY_DN205_c0_g1_i1:68-1564(+)
MSRIQAMGFLTAVAGAAAGGLRGTSHGLPEALLPSPATTVAHGLFTLREDKPVGDSSSYFLCDKPGEGTASVASGPGGCLNAQPGIASFNGAGGVSGKEVAKNQTVASFIVNPCGLVAPHTHANAAEVNTVIKGEAIVAQYTTQTGKLHVSKVSAGDSFFFAQGSYHWWLNLGTEQLATVGGFLNTGGPDAALMGYDNGAGIVGTLLPDQTLLHTLIGESTGKKITVPFGQHDSPLFPMLDQSACERARQHLQHATLTPRGQTFQLNPEGTSLFTAGELQSGTFDIMSKPVHGPGGGLRPLAGKVLEGMPFVSGTAETSYNGGLTPSATPQAVLWPGFTNVAGGASLVTFVVGYCGMVAIHTHVNAAEWNTVISGKGQVSYYQVNTGAEPQLVTMNVKKGDTFVFPQGSAHFWVNDSPTEELVTVGGFTAAFPDTAMLEGFLAQTAAMFPSVTDAVLGEGYRPARQLPGQTGADTLFPLLASRKPENCGGSIPCHSCQ